MMKNDSRKKRNVYIFLGVFLFSFLIFGVWIFFIRNKKNEKTVANQKNSRKEIREEMKETNSKQDSKKNVLTTPKISFSEYKNFYQKYPPASSIKIMNRASKFSSCEKFALLELVLLKKENGKISPFITDWCRLERRNGCGWKALHHDSNTDNKTGTFRYYFLVGNKCDCQAYPGSIYAIESLGDQEDLDYRFKIPEKEKLVFQKKFEEIKPSEEAPVYRMPIFVNDVLETRKTITKSNPQNRYENIAIHGVINDPSLDIDMNYLRKGVIYPREKHVKEDQWKIEMKKAKTGGSIAVYKENHPTSENDHWYLQLLQYRKAIESRKVDLSEQVDFDYRKQNWITKTIDITSMLKRDDINTINLKGKLVFLTIEDQNQNLKNGKLIAVYGSQPKRQKEQLLVKLSAPKGTYDLVFNDMVMKKDFHWPPE